MTKIGLVEAFRVYGATLVNHQYAVSAELSGAIVMSLWKHKFHKPGMLYVDRLSRWEGNGNKLFRVHLQRAASEKLPIYLIVSDSADPAAIDRGDDASGTPKTVTVRPDLVGHVEKFTGDEFQIRFVKRS